MVARAILLSLLEDAITRYIGLSPNAGKLLQPISGKVIAIRFTGLEWVFYLCPSDTSMQFLEHYESRPDTTLSGSPFTFANLLLSEHPTRFLFSGKLHIEGDLATGRHFQSLFKQLDIDWEEWLSHFTGEYPAHRIGNGIRAGLRWGRESHEAMKLNITEYLQEERRDLPTVYECNELFKQVDTIRADADRLDMRVNRLVNRISEISL